MSFELTVAGNAVPTDGAVFKSLKDELNLVFHLDSALANFLKTPLGQVPQSASPSRVSYGSQAVSFNPLEGAITFGFQGNAGGTLQIVSGGALVSYTDGLTSPQPQAIAVTAGTVYLVLTLDVSLSANATGAYSGGAYGVKASLNTADSYAVTYCKAFSPSTPVGEALATIFKGFVLPLHEQTLVQMDDGDYLLHEFDGNLNISFGAYAGLDKVLYAGQASVDVLKAFGSPLATVTASTRPEINAAVNLSFCFQYATRFEALLSKSGTLAKMHLFRSSKQTTSLGAKAGLTFNGNTTASISASTDRMRSSLVAAAGGTGLTGGAAAAAMLAKADGEIQKYVTEVNDKLNSWLLRGNGLQTNLQASIEWSKTRVLLTAYAFQTDAPRMIDAWKAAIEGDMAAALQTGAVTLDPGSGLEQDFQRKTAFKVNFFNVWNFSTWTQYAENTSMVYAGNNVFHMQAQIGRTLQTDSMGAMHNMDLYFAASADQGTAGTLSHTVVNLHVDLTAQNDPKATGTIATMLSAMEAGPTADALARDMHAFATNARQGTAQLQIVIPPSAYGRVNCDPYSNGKPLTTSTYNDAQNWKAFAQAADDLHAWALRDLSTVSSQMLAYLKTFAAWEALNEADTGDSTPNRLHTGDTAVWPSDFPDTDSGSKALISYSMNAGQAFMNFCDALQQLATVQDAGAAGATWNALVGMLSDAVKRDVNGDFLRPTALALTRLCASPATVVSGPAPTAIPAAHFAVTVTL